MPEPQLKPEELLEDEDSTTDVVSITQQNGTKLFDKCETESKKLKRKFQAVREKLADTRYSQVAVNRRRP